MLQIVLLAACCACNTSNLTGEPDAGRDVLPELDAIDSNPDPDAPPEAVDTSGWECFGDTDCDDGDPCTADECDAVTHTCGSEYRGYYYLGPDIRLTHDPYTSWQPRMIWTGSALGLIWTDGMDDLCDRTEEVCNESVYFKTLDPLGNELSSTVRVSAPGASIRVCATGLASWSLGTWTGSEFGINWTCVDYPYGSPSEARYSNYFQRASAEGRLLGDPVRYGTDQWSAARNLEWTGSEFALAWADETSTHFDRISSTGTHVATRRIPVEEWSLGLTWSGSEFGLLYFHRMDGYSTYGEHRVAILDPLGALTAELETFESSIGADSSIMWTGSDYFIGWSWTPETPIEDSYWLRTPHISLIGPGGGVLADTPLNDSPAYTRARLPIWTGSEIVVPWSTHPDMHRMEPGVSTLTRLAPDGTRTSPDIIFDDEYRHDDLTPVLWTGSEFIAVGSDYGIGDQEIYMNRFVFCE